MSVVSHAAEIPVIARANRLLHIYEEEPVA